ncbi:VanZ family protein [bacterium]|nr:VanZ family protein [bacterium]
MIIYASSISNFTILSSNSSLDRTISNLAHVPVFAILSFFWLKSFSKTQNVKTNVLILAGLILFAISDELHQSMVPGRTAATSDFVLDFIGILFGYVFYLLIQRQEAAI